MSKEEKETIWREGTLSLTKPETKATVYVWVSSMPSVESVVRVTKCAELKDDDGNFYDIYIYKDFSLSEFDEKVTQCFQKVDEKFVERIVAPLQRVSELVKALKKIYPDVEVSLRLGRPSYDC